MRKPVLTLALMLASTTAWAQTNFTFAPDAAVPPADLQGQAGLQPQRPRFSLDDGQYPDNPEAVQAFVSPDKWIIARYFELRREKQIRARNSRSLMPRDLPKGLTEQPKKGDILPAFELNPLPAPLLRDLPRLPAGITRTVVAHDVILLRTRNNEVVDVLEKVIR